MSATDRLAKYMREWALGTDISTYIRSFSRNLFSSSDGLVLYHYGYHYEIARKVPGIGIVFNTSYYSPTTVQVKSDIYWALRKELGESGVYQADLSESTSSSHIFYQLLMGGEVVAGFKPKRAASKLLDLSIYSVSYRMELVKHEFLSMRQLKKSIDIDNPNEVVDYWKASGEVLDMDVCNRRTTAGKIYHMLKNPKEALKGLGAKDKAITDAAKSILQGSHGGLDAT